MDKLQDRVSEFSRRHGTSVYQTRDQLLSKLSAARERRDSNERNGTWPQYRKAMKEIAYFERLLANTPTEESTMTNLFIISTEDVDAVLADRVISDEQRAAVYEAVSRMDASMVFEQIDDVIELTLTPE